MGSQGNQGKEIKVTDKRMFTPEGELREEYRFLNEKSTAAADASDVADAAEGYAALLASSTAPAGRSNVSPCQW